MSRNPLVRGVEVGDICSLQRNDLILDVNKEHIATLMLLRDHCVNAVTVLVALGVGDASPLIHSALQILLL